MNHIEEGRGSRDDIIWEYGVIIFNVGFKAGPAGRVKWHQTWGMRYDHPPDNGFERYHADSETVPRHFA